LRQDGLKATTYIFTGPPIFHPKTLRSSSVGNLVSLVISFKRWPGALDWTDKPYTCSGTLLSKINLARRSASWGISMSNLGQLPRVHLRTRKLFSGFLVQSEHGISDLGEHLRVSALSFHDLHRA